jgi:hypothetical protein
MNASKRVYRAQGTVGRNLENGATIRRTTGLRRAVKLVVVPGRESLVWTRTIWAVRERMHQRKGTISGYFEHDAQIACAA